MTTTIRPGRDEGDRTTPPSPAPGRRPVRTLLRDTGRDGASLGALLVGGTVAGCFVGLAPLLLYGFPVAAVAVALALLVRRQWYSYLGFLLIVWLSCYGVRRVVDWKTHFHSASPIIITGSLVSLLAIPWVLSARRPAYRDARAALMIGSAVVVFGFLCGVVTNGVAPAVADFLLLGAPVVTGLFVLGVPDDDARLRQVLQSTALWGCLLVGGYGVLQFLVLPPWDARWIVDSGVTTVGKPIAGQFRAFGTLSTTGPLGYVMAVLLLLLVAERRRRYQVPAAVVGMAALAVTLIRGGWIGVTLGILLLLSMGRKQAGRLVAVGVLLLVVVFAVGGPIQDRVGERASDTAAEGTQDTSLVARVTFQAQIAPQALTNPIGDGMGATGVATQLSSQRLLFDRFRNFDSGLFETLTRYGVLAGGALLLSVVYSVVRGVRRARAGGTLFQSACAAASVALAVGILLTDTLRSVYGIFFWTLIAVQGRPSTVAIARSMTRGALPRAGAARST